MNNCDDDRMPTVPGLRVTLSRKAVEQFRNRQSLMGMATRNKALIDAEELRVKLGLEVGELTEAIDRAIGAQLRSDGTVGVFIAEIRRRFRSVRRS